MEPSKKPQEQVFRTEDRAVFMPFGVLLQPAHLTVLQRQSLKKQLLAGKNKCMFSLYHTVQVKLPLR